MPLSRKSIGSGPTLAPLVAGFCLLLAIAVGLIWLSALSRSFNAAANASLEVQSAASRLLVEVQDAETGQRGYLLTGKREYLAPYLEGSREAPRSLTTLRRMLGDKPAQLAIVDRLERLVPAKLAELAKTVALADRGDRDGALSIVNNDSGNTFMTDIRGAVEAVEASATQNIAARRAESDTTTAILVGATILALLMVLALAAYTIATTARATRGLLAARDELRFANQNLERIIEERVGDLRVANEEIQRFAYIVSHDLRAPLVNVLGFTSELEALCADLKVFLDETEAALPTLVTVDRRTAIEAEMPEALGFIRASTSKMDRLINAILKLSREGRRKLSPEKIDLGALVEAQAASLSQQLSSKDAIVVVEGKLPALVSDRLAIEQIFGNLIENAVKYLSPARAGRITVSGATEDRFLRYDIADNGRGISDKDFERIFELFRRSGEQNTPGEGIGLAYVRNLARRLGGNVTVRSVLGEGSTFSVVLPAAFDPQRANAA